MRRRSKGLSFYEKKSKVSADFLKEFMIWALYTAVAVMLAFIVVSALGYHVSVIGNSMEPGLVNNQGVLVDRVCYRLRSIQKNDVVAFYPGGNEKTHPYVKRVIAVPGESVQIVDGELLINGIPDISNEEYDKMQDAGIADSPIILGENEYFVLGDNRNNSEDSRSASIGSVTESSIIGKAWLSLPEGENSLGIVH